MLWRVQRYRGRHGKGVEGRIAQEHRGGGKRRLNRKHERHLPLFHRHTDIQLMAASLPGKELWPAHINPHLLYSTLDHPLLLPLFLRRASFSLPSTSFRRASTLLLQRLPSPSYLFVTVSLVSHEPINIFFDLASALISKRLNCI